MLEERKSEAGSKRKRFCKRHYGALIFGITNDEVLVGLTDAHTISEKISETIKNKAVYPIPQVIMENHTEDGKDFIILKVLPGQKRPIIMLLTEIVSPMSVWVTKVSLQTQRH